MLICSSAPLVLGQSAFIETISKEDFLKNNARQSLFERLQNDTRYLNVTPIRINDLWSFQTDGELTFSLPDVQGPIHAVVTSPKRYSDTRYSWTGNILDSQHQPIGRAVFFQEGDKKFGTIDLPNQRFVIRDLNANVLDDQVLLEIDQAALPANSCGLGEGTAGPTPEAQVPPPNPPNPPNPPTPPTPPTPPGPCEAVVTVLFLHTQQVLDAGRDPVQLATMGLHALNEAIDSSAIPNTNLRVVSVGNRLLESFVEDEQDADNALSTLLFFLPRDSLTQLYRNQRRADLVILFQETDIFLNLNGINNYDTRGIANVNFSADPDKVYSVIEAGAPAWVVAHEIGHLFGCHHQPGGNPGGDHEFGNAHIICLQPVVPFGCSDITNTLMGGNNGSFIRRFSNPDKPYQGFVAGSESTNNARMIATTACPISEFREPMFTVFASGPTQVSPGIGPDYLYSSYYQNCDSTVSYHWEISWDYGNTFSHLSFAEDAYLERDDIPAQAPTGILRLTATCLGDTTSIALLHLTNWSAQNLTAEENDGTSAAMGNERIRIADHQEKGVMIYPNPAQHTLNVEFSSIVKGDLTIRLISVQGRPYPLYEKRNNEPVKFLRFDLARHLPGFYLLEVMSNDNYTKIPLILTRS